MFKDVLIVYNPRAGSCQGGKHAAKIEAVLHRNNIKTTTFKSNSITASHDYFAEIKKNKTHYDCVVIIGGDGTLGPTVDGMVRAGLDIPIYAYGRGTANDVATYYETMTDSMKKFEKIFLAGQTSKADTLIVNGQFAINVSCGGAFTNGVTKYNRRLKKIIGKAAYFLKAITVAATMRAQRVDFEVDGVLYSERVYLFLIVNSKNAGGIKNVGAIAHPNDGMLDLVAFRKCDSFGKLNIAYSIVSKKGNKSKNVMYLQGKHFVVTPAEPVIKNFTLSDMDGNAGPAYPLDVRVGDKQITFVCNRMKF